MTLVVRLQIVVPLVIPAPLSDLPVFGGRFVAVRIRGAGAHGFVYEVEDRVTGDRLALKTLRSPDADEVLELKREFRVLARHRHPNMVRLYELHAEGSQCFFTMELIDGVDLLSWVRAGRSDGWFDETALRAALGSLVQGLATLHAAGFAHGDVKPDNVLVDARGRVVILDLGAAAAFRSPERRRLAGTWPFCAPEQVQRAAFAPASDFYSVGVFLHCVLAGLDPGAYNGDAPPVSAASADLVMLARRLRSLQPAERPTDLEILAALVGSPVPAPFDPIAATELVGRTRELDVLTSAFYAVKSGEGAALIVTGGPGIGKTALVEHFLAGLRDGGDQPLVLDGRCYARESSAYNGFDGVMDRLCQHLRDEARAGRGRRVLDGPALATAFPVLRSVPGLDETSTAEAGPDLRVRAVGALHGLLSALARGRPVVVFIDDLQWASQESLALWQALVAQPSPPILLLATLRDDAGAPLAAALSARGTRRITLGPLAADASAALVARRWPVHVAVPDTDELARLAGDADGNPLLLAEIARSTADGTLSRSAAAPSLGGLLRHRIVRLGPLHRSLLDLLAIAGLPVPLQIVVQALASERGALHATLDDLEAANLIRPHRDAGSLDFMVFHDRVRETVAATVSPDMLEAVHGRLADAYMATLGHLALPLVVLSHLEGARRFEEAVRYALAAAEQSAAVLAFEGAADLFGRALALDVWTGPERAAVEERRAAALLDAGRSREASESFLSAASGAHTPVLRRSRTRQAAMCLLINGDVSGGFALFEQVLRSSDLQIFRSPLRLIAATLVHQARLRLRRFAFVACPEGQMKPERREQLEALAAASRHLGFLDPVLGYSFRTRALLLALDLGHAPLVFEGVALEGVARAARGGTRGLRFSRLQFVRAETSASTLADRAVLAGCRGTAAVFGGDFSGAVPVLEDAIAGLESHAHGGQRTGGLRHARTWYLKSLLDLGRLPILRGELARIRELATRQGDLLATAMLPRLCAALWLADDRPEQLTAELAAHPAHAVLITQSVCHWYDLRARVEVALYRGTVLDEAAELRRGLAEIAGSLFGRWFQLSRVEIRTMSARLELGVAAALPPSSRRRALALDRANELARMLRSERGMPYAATLAAGIMAGCSTLTDRIAASRCALAQVIHDARRADLELLAACASLRRDGPSDVTDAWFAAAGVVHPERIVAVYLPGCSESAITAGA